jgi:hypothetical protein
MTKSRKHQLHNCKDRPAMLQNSSAQPLFCQLFLWWTYAVNRSSAGLAATITGLPSAWKQALPTLMLPQSNTQSKLLQGLLNIYSPGGFRGGGTIEPRALTSMGSWTSVRKGSFIAALADHADHQGPPPTCRPPLCNGQHRHSNQCTAHVCQKAVKKRLP